MLAWHEGRDNILSIEAIPLELLGDCVSRVLILVEREREVTRIELIEVVRLFLNGLSFLNLIKNQLFNLFRIKRLSDFRWRGLLLEFFCLILISVNEFFKFL